MPLVGLAVLNVACHIKIWKWKWKMFMFIRAINTADWYSSPYKGTLTQLQYITMWLRKVKENNRKRGIVMIYCHMHWSQFRNVLLILYPSHMCLWALIGLTLLALNTMGTDRPTHTHTHSLCLSILCRTHTYRHTPATACPQALCVHLQPQLLPSW